MLSRLGCSGNMVYVDINHVIYEGRSNGGLVKGGLVKLILVNLVPGGVGAATVAVERALCQWPPMGDGTCIKFSWKEAADYTHRSQTSSSSAQQISHT